MHHLVFAVILSINIGKVPKARFLILKEVKGKKAEWTLFYWSEQKIPEATLTNAETEAQYLEGEPEQPEQYVLHANLRAKYIVTGDLMQCLQDSSL